MPRPSLTVMLHVDLGFLSQGPALNDAVFFLRNGLRDAKGPEVQQAYRHRYSVCNHACRGYLSF